MILLGLTGVAGSGKDTGASFLVKEYGFEQYAFADALKRMAEVDFGWDGKKDDRGRRLLQVLGTEAGREYDPDIWVKKLEWDIFGRQVPPFPLVVISDVRFENEAAFIRRRGGDVIRIVGRSYYSPTSPQGSHASEQQMADIEADLTLVNDGDLCVLHGRIERLMDVLQDEESR